MFVGIFGSAVKRQEPRDIDILIQGFQPTPEELALAETWRKEKGLENVSFDFHRGTIDRSDGAKFVWLPSALDVPADYEIVGVKEEEVEIHFQKFTGFASVLRALGDNPEACVAELIRMSGEKHHWIEIGIAPKADNQLPDWGDWDGYCQGVTALRSAVRHCRWSEIKKGIGALGKFLDRLVHEDPKVIPYFLEDGSPCSGNGVEIIAWIEWTDRKGCNHWRFSAEYLRGKPFTWSELEAILWPKELPQERQFSPEVESVMKHRLVEGAIEEFARNMGYRGRTRGVFEDDLRLMVVETIERVFADPDFRARGPMARKSRGAFERSLQARKDFSNRSDRYLPPQEAINKFVAKWGKGAMGLSGYGLISACQDAAIVASARRSGFNAERLTYEAANAAAREK